MSRKLTALRYAQAAYEIASENNQTDKWLEDLSVLKTAMSDSQVSDFFGNPKVAQKDKQELLKKDFSAFAPLALNFVCLLSSKELLDMSEDIYNEFEAMYNEHGGLGTAEVVSAVELSKAELESISKDLEKTFGKKMTIEAKVDPEILGGLIIRAGDKLIDGSIRTKIENMRQELASGTN